MEFDYFSAGEKRLYKRFRDLRIRLFTPLSKLLWKAGITPNMVSFFGLLLLVGFPVFIASNSLLSLLFLLGHLLMDAIDGVLARVAKKAGSMVDFWCDHAGYLIVILALTYGGPLYWQLSVVHLIVYALLLFFVAVRNKKKLPMRFAVKSKFPLYAVFALYALIGFDGNLVAWALAILTVLMIPSILSSMFILHAKSI